MDDAECGDHAKGAKGMLTARRSDAGSDFQPRLQAEAVRSPAWALLDRAGIIVDRSNADGVVKKGVAGRAFVPGRG